MNLNENTKNLQNNLNKSDITDSEIKSIREIFLREVANLKNLLRSNESIYSKRLDDFGSWKETAQTKIITLDVTIKQNKDNLVQINNWKDASEIRFSALENASTICRKDIDDIKDDDDSHSVWKENIDHRIKELEKWRWIQAGIIIALGTIWTIIIVAIQIFLKAK